MFGSDSQNAILAFVHRYSRRQLHPMVESLRRTGYSGRLVFFHSQVAPEELAYWRTLGIETVPSGFRLSRFRESMRKKWWAVQWLPFVLRQAIFRELCAMLVYRYYDYLGFLEREGGRLKLAMLTDVRDVLFQAKPFIPEVAGGIHAFEEDRCHTMGSEPFNRHWLEYSFSRRLADSVRNEPILCAGTVVGDAQSMVDLLQHILAVATTIRRLGSRQSGGDQVVFNVALRKSECPPVQIHRNGERAVLTAGIMAPEKIQFSPDGWIVNQAHEVIPVLHQLDRHSQLNERVLEKVAS